MSGFDQFREAASPQRCDNCRFAQRTTFGGQFCRFNPPAGYRNTRGIDEAVWPVVEDRHWCGKWERRWDPMPEAEREALRGKFVEIYGPAERPWWRFWG